MKNFQSNNSQKKNVFWINFKDVRINKNKNKIKKIFPTNFFIGRIKESKIFFSQ